MIEDQENLPLLHPVAEHRRVFAAQNPGRERWVTCCGACFCCAVCVFIVVPTVATSVTRNRDCDATKLAGQTPPYGGQLVPKETVLVERAGWFQLSKLVDVYDGAHANATRVGYFFDMNFLLWMRFGYADASDRVWFEGRYSGFFARFLPYLSLSLVRCDHAEAPPPYRVEESFWKRSWFCFFHCRRYFRLFERRDGGGGGDDTYKHAANAVFDSDLTWVALGARHAWAMNLTDAASGATLARAQQRFAAGGLSAGFRALSRWEVEVARDGVLPHWVVAFVAAIDDIQEDEARSGRDRSGPERHARA